MNHFFEMHDPVRHYAGPARATPERRRICPIGIVLFEGCSLMSAGVIAEAFMQANEIEINAHGHPAYHLSFLSHRGGNVASSSSMRVWTQGLDTWPMRDYGALFIAARGGAPMADFDVRLMSWLFEVSAAPLRRASERHCDSRASHAVAIDEAVSYAPPSGARLYITCQRPNGAPQAWAEPAPVFWLSESTAEMPVSMLSPADMAVAQIEADLGRGVAQVVARQLRPDLPRALASPNPPAVSDDEGATGSPENDDKILVSAHWMTEHFAEPISVADAARVAAMSERNYLRRFKLALGITPSEYLLRARLDMICRLLTGSKLPVDKIARRCGMGNGDRLAKIFRKRFNASPTEYRGVSQLSTPRRPAAAS